MPESFPLPPAEHIATTDPAFSKQETMGWAAPSTSEAFARRHESVKDIGETFDELASDSFRQGLISDTQAELASPAMQEVGRRDEEITRLGEQIKAIQDDLGTVTELNKEADRLRDSIAEDFGPGTSWRLNRLRSALRRLKGGETEIHGRHAPKIAEMFLAEAAKETPPRGTFINESQFRTLGKVVAVELDRGGQYVKVPLDSIVSAGGFESWSGRGNPASAAKIEEFAARDTDPVIHDELYGYILPNNKIVFMSGNAHRVGAAKKRLQKDPENAPQTIDFDGSLRIVRLGYYPDGLQPVQV